MIFRWLGTAGIELKVGDCTLAVDPFFTRPSILRLFCSRINPDVKLIERHLPTIDHVLITHAHYDHVMDAAAVLQYSGAKAYGSANSCRLMEVMGASKEDLQVITDGDLLRLGPFSVTVYNRGHWKTPIDGWINGELPEKLSAPLRMVDYRMDACFGFRIEVDRLVMLVGDLQLPADVLFTIPIMNPEYYERLLPQVAPKLVVPIHWDDFFKPLDQPLRPVFTPTKLFWPPLKRVNLGKFKRHVESLSDGYRVLIPTIFKEYHLGRGTADIGEFDMEDL